MMAYLSIISSAKAESCNGFWLSNNQAESAEIKPDIGENNLRRAGCSGEMYVRRNEANAYNGRSGVIEEIWRNTA